MHKFAGFLAILQITCNLYLTFARKNPLVDRNRGLFKGRLIKEQKNKNKEVIKTMVF
jgi:hypothetical protein